MSLVFENVAGLDDDSTRFDGDEETDCRSDLAGSCVDAEHDEYDPTIDDAYVASLSILQRRYCETCRHGGLLVKSVLLCHT